MLARRSFSIATSRVRLPMSEQKIASVVNGVSKAVEAHANPIVTDDKADTQKSTGILRNPNMALTSEAIARGRLATLDRRTDQARLEQMHADGGLTLTLTPGLTLTLTPSISLSLSLSLTLTQALTSTLTRQLVDRESAQRVRRLGRRDGELPSMAELARTPQEPTYPNPNPNVNPNPSPNPNPNPNP